MISVKKSQNPAIPIQKWWKESVIYQIYPRSFNDSNDDGIGDLEGIRQKLDYIKSLGVDIIWLSPIYKSPNDDNGYDISDYYDIMDEFGNMADFDQLLKEIHQKGMRLMMDLVVNHTSDEHSWFEESRKSVDNPYRDYYIWRKPVEGGLPNNWKSYFSGSTWEYDETTGEYYLHLFSKKQPDLNWENPKVREEVYKLMQFWLDKGVDGFRMDVIPFISKDLSFPPFEPGEPLDLGAKYANGPRVHEFLQEMHREVLAHFDVVTIGEGPGISTEEGLLYVGNDRNELNMIFHLDHMLIDFGPGGRFDPKPVEPKDWLAVFEKWDKAMESTGWMSLFLGNHDFPRMVSRFGDDNEYRVHAAKLLATFLMTLRGTPTVYQGDEIGMTNIDLGAIENHRDLETLNAYNEIVKKGGDTAAFLEAVHPNGRDNARTPVQWKDAAHGGFTGGTPWIMANPNYSGINVKAAEANPDSILHYYRKVIRIRKENPVLVYGDVRYVNMGPDAYAYVREMGDEKVCVVLNFSSEEITFAVPDEFAETAYWFGNYPDGSQSGRLRAWEAVVNKY